MSEKNRFDGLMTAANAGKLAKAKSLDEKEHPDVETFKHSDVQTSKSKNPDYQRTTVYLPKTLHRKLRVAAMNEGKEMSDVIGELVKQWLDSKKEP